DAGGVGGAVRVPGEPAAGRLLAASDTARGDREQLSAPGPGAATVLRAAFGVSGRLYAGSGPRGGPVGCRGGVRPDPRSRSRQADNARVSGTVAGVLADRGGGAERGSPISAAGDAAGVWLGATGRGRRAGGDPEQTSGLVSAAGGAGRR